MIWAIQFLNGMLAIMIMFTMMIGESSMLSIIY